MTALPELTARFRRAYADAASAFRQAGLRAAAATVARRVIGVLLRGLQFAHEYSTDRRLGIRSRGRTYDYSSAEELSTELWYQPSTAKRFQRALRGLSIDTAEYTFVDLGCGKGTALFLAARAGFRRVIGVEIVHELLAVAQHNAEIFNKTHRMAPIELVLANAADYVLPKDPLVLYIFNSFGESVLRAAVDHAATSLARDPRPVFFVYANPKHGDVISESYSHTFHEVRRNRDWRLYEAKPVAALKPRLTAKD